MVNLEQEKSFNSQNVRIFMEELSKQDLIESGVHFGHPTQKWNPEFKQYIVGQKNGIHIINVQKTIENINIVGKELSKIASNTSRRIISTSSVTTSLLSKSSRCSYITFL